MGAPPYRGDIDGLRAVAVLAVIFYHLDWPVVRGGFVGVDVFFVISGYLITSLVRREAAERRFSFRSFFVRRVRRLAPSLVLVTLVTLLVAPLLLLPVPLSNLAESALTQPIAVQNVYFLADGEYFHGSDTKPLLHTWSLGVEEQFYLLWPVLLVWLSARSRRTVLMATAALLVASFGSSLFLQSVTPKASFFLLPARAWELGLGATLAVLEERGPVARGWLNTALGVLGAVGLAWSILFVSEDGFPGTIALVPVLSAAAIIAHGTAAASSPLAAALALRPPVVVGLGSYALYLWHWPVIVLLRFAGLDPTAALPGALVALLMTAALSFASYRLVEDPIRHRRALSGDRALLFGTAALTSFSVMLAVAILWTRGAAFRYSEPGRSMLVTAFETQNRCGFLFRALSPGASVCHLEGPPKGPGVLLWGNSHADMWSPLFRRLATEAGRPFWLSARNCRPIPDSSFCGRALQQSVLRFVEERGVTDVVLASSWYGAYGVPDETVEAELTAVVAELAARNVDVWLVVDIPKGPMMSPTHQYEQNPEHPTLGSLPKTVHDRHRLRELDLFERIAQRSPRVNIIDPSSLFCSDETCRAGDADAGQVWYIDGDHLSVAGAMRGLPLFAPVFR